MTTALTTVTGIPTEQLDVHEPVQNYGFDSIVITKLTSELEKIIGQKEPSLFFSARTIYGIAETIHAKYKVDFNWSSVEQAPAIPVIMSHTIPAESAPTVPPVRLDDIAIIGIAGQYPQAASLVDFFENLKQGVDCIEEIPPTRWDAARYLGATQESGKMRARWGGFINGVHEFDYENFNMSLREALVTHPEERLLLMQAWHCFENAGYNPLGWVEGHGAPIGVYIGASAHEYSHLIAEGNQVNGSYLPFSTQTFSYANRLSYFYNLTGPSVTVDTACSSSLYAIYDACNGIRSGACQTALAGGYVPGEGVGVILLKRLDLAQRDGDHILAVIKGVAAGNDGRTNGFTVPNPAAQSAVIQQAIANAAVDPASITAIECHGTGTALGDPIEIAALTTAFRSHTPATQFCAVSSVKANIGHLEAAAGIAQVTKMILQLNQRLLFPNVMHSPQVNPHIDFAPTPFYLQQAAATWPTHADHLPRRAGISSFGAGGTNVHLILEEYRAPQSEAAAPGAYYLLPFSADSPEQLAQIVQESYRYLADPQRHLFPSPLTVKNIAGTLQLGRAMKRQRLALICQDDLADLLAKLQAVIENFPAVSSGRAVVGHPYILYGVADKQRNTTAPTSCPQSASTDERTLIDLACQWVQGQPVAWATLAGRYAKVALPGYRFKAKLVDAAHYRAAQSAPVETVGATLAQTDGGDAVQQQILAVLTKVLGALPDTFDVAEDFADYGIDSIMASRIHAELCRHYGELDLFVLFEYSSVAKLAAYLRTRQQPVAKPTPPAAPAAPPTTLADSDAAAISAIHDLSWGGEKVHAVTDILPFSRYIAAYQAHDGKLLLQRMDVAIRNRRTIEVIACGAGETVVLLPPFNSSAIVWIQQLLVLSQQFKVLVIHYPGLGASDWLDEMQSFDDLAAIVTEVIDQLVADHFLTDRQATFVGWSLGGFLAQTLTVTYPDYVKRLILISTTTISWSSAEYQISGEEFSRKSAQEFRENYRKLPLFMRKMSEIQQWHKQGQVEKFALATAQQKVINRYFLMIARYRNLEIADRIKVKTYLLSGAEDELMPTQFARELHTKIQGSEYFEVEGGKHFLSLFNKEIVNKKLLEWLGK